MQLSHDAYQNFAGVILRNYFQDLTTMHSQLRIKPCTMKNKPNKLVAFALETDCTGTSISNLNLLPAQQTYITEK